jgi:two-component system CheB/CheR fusion protein
MAIVHGTLHLLEPTVSRGIRHPIDFFFRSLSEDCKEKAICIILSGTGTEGTLGLKSIKGEGGMVMAQDVTSAAYDGMPASAIATGFADFILPPEKMPEQLLNYIKQPYIKGTREATAIEQIAPLKKIFILVRDRTGHDFSLYKENTIIRRIERRMNIHQISKLTDYVRYLSENPSEIDILFKELLIGVTSFFRDPEAFEILQKKILPDILKNKTPALPVRVWVPACSTGEEAYSIAIIFKECLDELKSDINLQIFATDVDKDAIEKARGAVYPASIAVDVSQERLERFFTKAEDSYRVKKDVREMVTFAIQSLIKDPPFSMLNMLSCRNLLIYLSPVLQKKEVIFKELKMKTNGSFQTVNLIVRPLVKPGIEGLVMVIFEDMACRPSKPVKKGYTKQQINQHVIDLEQELKSTKENLQATIEEMETSNEELQSTNEEFQAANEELQSANEELETSREELQSVNEELMTLNSEHQTRIEENLRVINDMNNLLTSTEIATVFLDNDLNIKGFTPAATKIINLIKTDIGRPVKDFSSNLVYENLIDDVLKVLNTLVSRETEVSDKNGNWYLMRILPYRTTENVIDGAVVTFIDVTERKRTMHMEHDARVFAEGIVNTVRESLLVLDKDLRVISANRSFLRTFNTSKEEIENKSIFKINDRSWDIPALRKLVEEILPEDTVFNDFEVEMEFPGIGCKKMLLNARRIYEAGAGIERILLAIEDVTEQTAGDE